MPTFKKEALGTLLEIIVYNTNIHQADIDECFFCIKEFEQKYSRFRKDNFLAQLNRSWKGKIDRELSYLLKIAQELHTSSDWYFDITLLPFLENAGYGISQKIKKENIWSSHVTLSGNTVTLKRWIQIDLGSLWKWYMLDVVYDILENKYDKFTLNFWGDIRVKGTETIGLEDPLRPKKLIGELSCTDLSFASSSGERRKLKWKHHLINPKTWESPNEILIVYVTHKLWVFADAYATALFVCPLKKSLKLLEVTPGLEALIISKTGKIHCSQGFNKYLTLY